MLKKNSITACTQVFCIIGHPIEHTMSPVMHNAAIQDLGLNSVYLAFDVLPNRLKTAIKGMKALDIRGINVTMPYKQRILKFIDELDPLAEKIGAVNTIKNEDSILIGRNTDATGGKNAILNAGFELSGKNILILGGGGAARALSFVLADEVNKIVIINRTIKRALKLAIELQKYSGINVIAKHLNFDILKEEIKNIDLLINTTPIGMYPKIDESPIPAELLHKDLFLFDIIYNPLKTKLMHDALENGCKVIGGLDMLISQGALAFEWWTNKKPNLELMKNTVIKHLKSS